MKHTPGPWHVLAPAPALPFYISTDPTDHLGSEVAVLYGKDSEADAKLVAAAPDLLANLEFAVKLFEGIPFFSGTAQVEAMRSAIRKASIGEATEESEK